MTTITINYNNKFDLRYQLRDTAFAQRWLLQLKQAQDTNIPIDDPTRFSGFDTSEANVVIKQFAHCINTINTFKPLIARSIHSVDDQDTLNYLHHVFEVYHGMLGQPHEIFLSAPEPVQLALAQLNVLVHRAESIARGQYPRHVVTYYGLDKSMYLEPEDYELFEKGSKFGTMYANYVEIGKDIRDLTWDNDQYISEKAFMPWQRYSADFNVKFWQDDPLAINELTSKINEYYAMHSDIIDQHKYGQVWGYLPVADCIDWSIDLDLLRRNQQVTKVTIEE